MRKELSSSFGSGFGAAIGVLLAIAVAVGCYAAYDYLEKPVPAKAVDPRVGTPEQAKAAALGALRKRGVSDLAKEAKAVFDANGNRWAVYGQAKSDAGKLIEVSALVSVGTIDGKRHWRVTFLEIDGKGYLGK